MLEKYVKLMCGPVDIPQRVLKAMNRESFTHRGSEYEKIHQYVVQELKNIFRTKNDVLVATSSGTGGMEMSIVNFFSPRDHVVVPIIGNFSEQFASMCEAFDLDVTRVAFEYGETSNVDKVMKFVTKDTKGVLVTHNESSTGVFNDLEEYGKRLKDSNTILIADSVSGLGGMDMRMDQWNVDVVVTGSQKSLMAPAGLAFLSFSEKALEKAKSSTLPKYYFDLTSHMQFNVKHQTPRTPGIYTLLAVEESLKMIQEEGYENVLKRHIDNSNLLRKGLRELGLHIFPKDENYASNTLTAVYVKSEAKHYVSQLSAMNIIVNGGLDPIAEDTFRIGTMGYISPNDIYTVLNGIDMIKNGIF